MAEAEIYWEGQSGTNYGYWIHSIRTQFNDEPGNYIYAIQTLNCRPIPEQSAGANQGC